MDLSDSLRARLVDPPKTYEEMRARPGFQDRLDARSHALRKVVSPYNFQALAPCGLKSCRREHRFGLLVETEDGLETNLGHVCGARIFPDWDIKVAAHKRERDLQDLLDRAAFLRSKAPTIRERVRDLVLGRFGILWVDDVRRAVRQVVGDDLFDSLRWAHKRGGLEVYQERLRSDAEIDRIVEANRGRIRRSEAAIDRTPVGQLEPMPWIAFDQEGDVRSRLLTPLDQFLLLDPTRLDLKTLRKAVKPFEGWEKMLTDAQATIDAAARFFEELNLRRLVLWIPDSKPRVRESLSNWIVSPACKQLSEGRLSTPPR
jgi:hypothetical protein